MVVATVWQMNDGVAKENSCVVHARWILHVFLPAGRVVRMSARFENSQTWIESLTKYFSSQPTIVFLVGINKPEDHSVGSSVAVKLLSFSCFDNTTVE